MLHSFLQYLRCELNRADLTIQAYETDLSQFCDWLTPNNPDAVDFLSVTSSDVRAWLAYQAKKGDSPRTLRRKIITLRTFYKWLMKTGAIKRSPIAEVPLPKLTKPLPDIVKPEEIEEALKSIQEEDEGEALKMLKLLVVEMLYSLGIRRAELVGINDSDISSSGGVIKVTGKRSKQRVIPLPQKLLDKIKRWQQIRGEALGEHGEDSPLFVIKGKRITTSQVYNIVHKVLEMSSARKKSPHALRHSFASVMLNGGAEIDSVREFLGHTSLATTQIYTHISFKDIQKAYANAHPRSGSDDTKTI